ncbi:DNA-binding response OmpR family regulator [Mucilaginibacter sp. UYNi724]
MKNNVLVIEDEPVIGKMMCILLEMEGYKVICYNDLRFAKGKLETKDIALVMLDLKLGQESGEEMASHYNLRDQVQSVYLA